MRLLAAESEESTSSEVSAAVVRRYYDLVSSHPGDVGRYDIVAPDAIFREPGSTLHGREAFRKRVADFITAFPDLRCSIDDLVVDDDKVAVRWTLSGTHQGAFGPYPATNKQVTLTGIGLHRVANGQMVEAWGCFDTLGASLQLGANLVLPELAKS